MDMWYKDSCILIGIPKWSEGQQQLVKLSIAEPATSEVQKQSPIILFLFPLST